MADTDLALHMGELKGRCRQQQCECLCPPLRPPRTPAVEQNKAPRCRLNLVRDISEFETRCVKAEPSLNPKQHLL